MASCDVCGTTIIFGGIKEGELRFCKESCQRKGILLRTAQQLPETAVYEFVQKVSMGNCPECGGPGPVDVYTAHSIWSALILTSWKSQPSVCCRSCGTKKQALGLLSSGLLGWWGFPFGFIMTPVQIVRNLIGMAAGSNATPSKQLEKILRMELAVRAMSAQAEDRAAPPLT